MTAAHAAAPSPLAASPDTLLQGMQPGILLAFTLFGLLLFLYTRAKPPGLYTLFMALLLLHSLCVQGLSVMPATDEQRGIVIGTASLSLAAGGLFVLAWLKVYTNLSPGIWLTGMALAALNLATAILALTGLHGAALVLAMGSGAALMLLLYGAAWRLAVRGVREARYVVLGLSVLITGAVTACLLSFDAVAASPLNIWAMQIAIAITAPLLAFGLVECRQTTMTRALRAEHDTREAEQGKARRLEAMLAVRTEELAAANRKIGELSLVDELTGAFNRRHFDQTSASLLARRNRDDPFAMCIFQVDDLHDFDQRYGPEARDQALRNVTGAVKSELRRSGDCLFRLGDEAFGVMFTASTPERALRFAERLRASVKDLRLPHAGNPDGVVTSSFGVAWWCVNAVDELTPKQIDAEVDSLLRAVAVDGRDGVVMHTA